MLKEQLKAAVVDVVKEVFFIKNSNNIIYEYINIMYIFKYNYIK